MNFGFLGPQNFAIYLITAWIQDRPHHLAAEFLHDAACIADQLFIVSDGHYPHLLWSQPKRKIPCIMLDEKGNETLMSPEGRAMDAEWGFLLVVTILVNQAKPFGHGKIHLVRGDRKFPAGDAPDLDIYLGPIERRLVRDLHEIDVRLDQHAPNHVFGLFPKLRFIH